jgi:2-dehydropantoate 2-reductase
MTKRVTIVGLGAIGGWVAARLALAGHEVSALVRTSSAASLHLHDEHGEQQTTVRRATEAAELGPQDLIVLAVKAPALAEAAMAAGPLIGSGTLILPMLNGVPWWFLGERSLTSVDPDGRIRSALPLDRTVGCVVHAAVLREGPDRVRVQRADGLLLGEPQGGTSERVQELASIFTKAGLPAEPVADIRRAIWYKLWGNMTINPVSALTLATADRILASAETRPFLLACMAEAAAVGARIGCPIEESGEDRMAVTARLGAFRTSMLQDVEAARPVELEALLGAPREIATHVGIPTPNIDALYGLTRLMAESKGLL